MLEYDGEASVYRIWRELNANVQPAKDSLFLAFQYFAVFNAVTRFEAE